MFTVCICLFLTTLRWKSSPKLTIHLMLYWNVLDTNAVLRYFTVNSGVTSLGECKQLCASHGSCVGIEYNEGTLNGFWPLTILEVFWNVLQLCSACCRCQDQTQTACTADSKAQRHSTANLACHPLIVWLWRRQQMRSLDAPRGDWGHQTCRWLHLFEISRRRPSATASFSWTD